MSQPHKIISVEVTNQLHIAPDEERARYRLHFKGDSLDRLLALVDHVEAGRFYEGAKMYFKECKHSEREAVGVAMGQIFDSIGKRQLQQRAWEARDVGVTSVTNDMGYIFDESSLVYPKYTLVQPTPPAWSSDAPEY